MKVEYLETGSPECPLIRIHGHNYAAASLLARSIERLINKDTQKFELTSLNGYRAVGGITLTCSTVPYRGILTKQEYHFEWKLPSTDWETALERLRPFMDPRLKNGFQWLWEGNDNSPTRVLISRDGQW